VRGPLGSDTSTVEDRADATAKRLVTMSNEAQRSRSHSFALPRMTRLHVRRMFRDATRQPSPRLDPPEQVGELVIAFAVLIGVLCREDIPEHTLEPGPAEPILAPVADGDNARRALVGVAHASRRA